MSTMLIQYKVVSLVLILVMSLSLSLWQYALHGKYVMAYRERHGTYIPWTSFERMDALANRHRYRKTPFAILWERQATPDLERLRWYALALYVLTPFVWMGGMILWTQL